MMASGVMTRAHTAPYSILPFWGAIWGIAVAVAAPGISINFEQPLFMLGGLVAVPLLIAAWLLFASQPERIAQQVLTSGSLPLFSLLLYATFEFVRGGLGVDPIVATLSGRTGIVVLTQCLLAAATAICVAAAPPQHRFKVITGALFYSFLWSCGIQAIADLTGAFAAITNQTAAALTPSVSLALIGIHRNRMQMIFASGLNASAVYPLVLFLGCILHKQGPAILRFVGSMLAAYLLLAIDSRAAILAPIVALGLLIPFTKSPKIAATVYATMPTWPLIIVYIVSWLPTSIHDLLSSRYANYGMFSGREFIWKTSLSRISSDPFGTLFVGYGIYGHLASSAESLYAHLFVFYNQKVQTGYSMHNAFVQTLFDGGILGIAALAWPVWKTLERLGYSLRAGDDEANAARFLLAVMITYLIVGMTEVAFTPYLREAYGLLLVVMFLAATVFSGQPRRAA